MNAIINTVESGRFATLPEIQQEADAVCETLLAEHDALSVYIAAKQLSQLAEAVEGRVRDMAVGEALTQTGGAYGGDVSYRGVGIQVRGLPARWSGYSEEVSELEREIAVLKKRLEAQKKIEQLHGSAQKYEQGCTLVVTLSK